MASRTALKKTVKKQAAGSPAKKAGGHPSGKNVSTKVAATKRPAAVKKSGKEAARTPASMPKAGKDPKGGLTAKGREFFNQRDGSHLLPGVKGAADTPEKMKRKGSFLRRHFARPRGPMVDDQGRPTRLALSAQAWGEPLPKTLAAAKKLAARGHQLLEQYHKQQDTSSAKGSAGTKAVGSKAASSKSTAKKGGPRKSPSKT